MKSLFFELSQDVLNYKIAVGVSKEFAKLKE